MKLFISHRLIIKILGGTYMYVTVSEMQSSFQQTKNWFHERKKQISGGFWSKSDLASKSLMKEISRVQSLLQITLNGFTQWKERIPEKQWIEIYKSLNMLMRTISRNQSFIHTVLSGDEVQQKQIKTVNWNDVTKAFRILESNISKLQKKDDQDYSESYYGDPGLETGMDYCGDTELMY